MLMFSLYTIMDGVVLSHAMGEYALAAINLVMPYINAVFAVAIFLAMGTSTVVAVLLGRGENDEANRIFTQNTWVFVALSLLLTVLVEIFVEPIARFLGATENTFAYVVSYLRTIAPFTVSLMLGYGLEVLVKTGGHPMVSIWSMCFCFVTNVVLNILFIVVFKWEMFGAAIATGIAQSIALAVFLTHFLSGKSSLRLVRIKKPFLGIYKKIIPLGLSDFSGEISIALVTFLFNRVVFSVMGEDGVVSYAVIAYINNIVVMLMTGVSQGMQPLVSLSYGAGNERNCRWFFRAAQRTVLVLSLALFAACQLFPESIVVLLLERESAMFAYTTNALRLFSYSFLFVGFNLCSAGFLNSIEQPGRALVISMGRGIVMITSSLFILSALFGDTGLWLATGASEAAVLVINIILTATLLIKKKAFWKTDKLERAGE